MSTHQRTSSTIEDVLLTTPAGQAACLFRGGLARIHNQHNAKEPRHLGPDLEHQSSAYILTKGPTVATNEQNEVGAILSHTDTTPLRLAEDWSMAKRVYTSVVICLYT